MQDSSNEGSSKDSSKKVSVKENSSEGGTSQEGMRMESVDEGVVACAGAHVDRVFKAPREAEMGESEKHGVMATPTNSERLARKQQLQTVPAPALKAHPKSPIYTWEPTYPFSYPVGDIPLTTSCHNTLTPRDLTEIKHLCDGSNANIFTAVFQGEKVVIKMIKEEVENEVRIHCYTHTNPNPTPQTPINTPYTNPNPYPHSC
jgi:hypothetical protein